MGEHGGSTKDSSGYKFPAFTMFISSIIFSHLFYLFIAELRRAKRASGAPWVIKFGKPSIRENWVMT